MSESAAGEAYTRWMANLTFRHHGIRKGHFIEPEVLIYSGTDDVEYMKSSHLAMRHRDPRYPEIIRAARAKAKAETKHMLREMVERGMIPAHMGPPDEPEDPDREEAA